MQPEELNLHGKSRVLAIFSMAKLRMLAKKRGIKLKAKVNLRVSPRHAGQKLTFGRQLPHSKCPLLHCRYGGNMYSMQTGHSKADNNSELELVGESENKSKLMVESKHFKCK